MREVSWIALFKHIPPEQQDGLMLITRAGTEITINNFLCIEREFLAFRGRLAGSQDGGRMFMVPYANIDYLGTVKAIKDTDYQEMYKVFNMGHRMELYVDEQYGDTIISISKSFNVDAQIVGRVEAGTAKQVTVKSPFGTFEYH